MKLERLLQYNIGLMALLSTLLFGIGQQNAKLPMLAIFVVTTSLVFTEHLKWFTLNRFVANLFAVMIAVYTLNNFFFPDPNRIITADDYSREKLLAIADLVAYLQFALFYQQKSPRIYWHLIALSLLQVVVAAVLDFGLGAGLILFVYFFVTVGALTLFLMHREVLQVERANQIATGMVPAARWWFDDTLRPAKQSDGKSPITVAFDTNEMVQCRLPWRILIRQIVGLTAAVLILTIAMFYSVPRHGETVWQGPGVVEQTEVGFAPEVNLNESSLVYENDELVMRVTFYDHASGEPYEVDGDVYYRGAVLTDYTLSSQVARWQEFNADSPPRAVELPEDSNPSHDLVRQEIVFEGRRESVRPKVLRDMQILFGVYPATKIEETSQRVRYDQRRRLLFRYIEAYGKKTNRLRYSMGTTAMKDGRQMPITPYWYDTGRKARDSSDVFPMPAGERDRLVRFDRRRFRNLSNLATQTLQRERVDTNNPVQVARTLESHFRNSELYTYTLDFRKLQRDESLDPIEDFVTNHRRGHCEYFASALAMMLRSQGIPARLVVGYKSAEFNLVGNYYQVRQRHAHAWVEAYLTPAQAQSVGTFNLGESSAAGGVWLRLDPTPIVDELGPAQFQFAIVQRITHAIDFAQLIWTDYVVGLNSQRQHDAIYNPLEAQTSETLAELSVSQEWTGGQPARARRLALPVGMVMVLSSMIVIVMYRLGTLNGRSGKQTRLGRVFKRLSTLFAPRFANWVATQSSDRSRRRKRVDFLDRLIALLARYNIKRSNNQTQREFAKAVECEFVASPARREIAALPKMIVDAYYRVRFGDLATTNHEHEAIQRALERLDETLSTEQQLAR